MIHAPIDEIVRVIGMQLALLLAERFGGRTIYLPHPSRVKPETPAAQLLGIEAACRLASEWPQCVLSIPKAAEYLRQVRDREIRAEPNGMTVGEIAFKYGLTERHVFRILATPESGSADNPQKPLFGSRP